MTLFQRSDILPENENFCELCLLQVKYCDQDPETYKQPYAWKCVHIDVAIGFQNQNLPSLAIGRKIAKFTAFWGNLGQTYLLFKTLASALARLFKFFK